MNEKITGVIDSIFGGNQFGGWARQSSAVELHPVTIEAYYDGDLVESTAADRTRNDMSNPCGFICKSGREVSVDDLRERRFLILAKALDGTTQELTILPKTLENFGRWWQGRQAALTGDDAVRQILAGLTTSNRPLLKAVANAVERFRLGDKVTIIGSAEISELSMFGLPVGLKSPDGTSVVGREGRMFVLAGTNQLLDQYRQTRDDLSVQAAAKSWVKLFRVRRTSVLQAGARQFVQIIIPEKSTVIPEYFPIMIETPSALMAEVICLSLDDDNLAECFFDAHAALAAEKLRQEAFRHVDSHLSVHGAAAISRELLAFMRLQWLKQELGFERRAYVTADLGAKFTNQPLSEIIDLPCKEDLKDLEAGLSRTELWEPPSGKHIGTRSVWKNSHAPNPETVVVFGNSFFERGSSATTLSWWFARLFSEFHFVWDPNLDADYVKRCKADIVICQTNERFLSKIAKC